MQNRRPHEEERNGRNGKDHHADPGIQIHHSNPAARSIDPFRAVIHSPHIARIPFFKAPVGVVEQLGCTNSGYSEHSESDGEFTGRQAKRESLGHFIPRNWKICRRQRESRSHGDQCQANNSIRR